MVDLNNAPHWFLWLTGPRFLDNSARPPEDQNDHVSLILNSQLTWQNLWSCLESTFIVLPFNVYRLIKNLFHLRNRFPHSCPLARITKILCFFLLFTMLQLPPIIQMITKFGMVPMILLFSLPGVGTFSCIQQWLFFFFPPRKTLVHPIGFSGSFTWRTPTIHSS